MNGARRCKYWLLKCYCNVNLIKIFLIWQEFIYIVNNIIVNYKLIYTTTKVLPARHSGIVKDRKLLKIVNDLADNDFENTSLLWVGFTVAWLVKPSVNTDQMTNKSVTHYVSYE